MPSGTALIGAVLLGLGAVAPARAEAASRGLPPAVSSLLKDRCVKCHGPARAKARLDLSTSAGIRQGGKKGPAVVPGDLRRSLLWERVAAEEMPPDEPLLPVEREVLRAWIAGGAAGLPRAIDRAASALGHWAFRPLASPKPPAVRDA